MVVATTVLADRAANDEALADARYTTEVLARSVAEPALPPGLVDGDAGAIDRFDREVRRPAAGRRRTPDQDLGGRRHDRLLRRDRADRRAVPARRGGARDPARAAATEAEVSDLAKPENRFETDSGGLVEVYTQIRSPEGEPLLFEAYYSAADIDAAPAARCSLPFRRITVGGAAGAAGRSPRR